MNDTAVSLDDSSTPFRSVGETMRGPRDAARLIVLTGGPGAGKTAVLETVRRQFVGTVDVVPEAAAMLFGGGFPRRADPVGRAAAQRAIYRVQRELEDLALHDRRAPIILCDRGSLDALAYWPYDASAFFAELHTSVEDELARYATVIHLRTPSPAQGYNLSNPVRIETPEQAAGLDQQIERAWAGHTHRHFVDGQDDFFLKLTQTLQILRQELGERCVVDSRRPAP